MKTTKLLFAALTGLTLCAQDADPGKSAVPAPTVAAAAAAPASDTRTNAPDILLPNGEKGIRLNLRGVPLVDVLNYMSEAAGFIINVTPGTDIKGKVDVWSNQPLSKAEAVKLLNTVLNDHDLASTLKDRTLTIFSRDTGKTKNIKVVKGANPEEIEATDEMVTQIIPVKYANAAALIQNLQPLLADYAQNGLSANESGNSLLLTATKSDVKRVVEIVSALDTAIASVSEIKVYPLKYADATALVASIKELFTPPAQQQNQNNNRGQFLQQMFGGGGPGGFGGGGFGGPGGFGGGPGGNRGGGAATTGSRGNVSATAARVVAVADERSNSLIVAAPGDALPEIDRLIKEIDVEVDDVMEIRMFPLVNADPLEISDQLATLFPDPTATTSNNQNRNGFGGPRFGGFGNFGGNRGGQSTASDRAKKQSRVVAVADQRTSSVIVTASHDLMPQIEGLIKGLDQRRAKRQIVRVYQVENGDIDQIQQVLRDTFDRSNMSRNNTTQSALSQRSQQNAQNQGQNNTGFGGQGGGGGLGTAFGR